MFFKHFFRFFEEYALLAASRNGKEAKSESISVEKLLFGQKPKLWQGIRGIQMKSKWVAMADGY